MVICFSTCHMPIYFSSNIKVWVKYFKILNALNPEQVLSPLELKCNLSETRDLKKIFLHRRMTRLKVIVFWLSLLVSFLFSFFLMNGLKMGEQ